MSRIARIEVDEQTRDVTFFFEDSDEPWGSSEFISDARKRLRRIEEAIDAFDQLSEKDDEPEDAPAPERVETRGIGRIVEKRDRPPLIIEEE